MTVTRYAGKIKVTIDGVDIGGIENVNINFDDAHVKDAMNYSSALREKISGAFRLRTGDINASYSTAGLNQRASYDYIVTGHRIIYPSALADMRWRPFCCVLYKPKEGCYCNVEAGELV